jgi:hypothetical protein
MRAAIYGVMSLVQWLSIIVDASSLIAAAIVLMLAGICYALAGLKQQEFVGSKTLGGRGVAQMIVWDINQDDFIIQLSTLPQRGEKHGLGTTILFERYGVKEHAITIIAGKRKVSSTKQQSRLSAAIGAIGMSRSNLHGCSSPQDRTTATLAQMRSWQKVLQVIYTPASLKAK